MSTTLNKEEWSTVQYPKWFVVLRITLGICLLIKGFQFIQNQESLTQMISQSGVVAKVSWLTPFIPWIHLFGGLMILLGLFTRIAVIIQLPVLVGAIIFVNINQDVTANGTELLFSTIIFLLLLFFLMEGAGPFSIDKLIKQNNS